LVPFFPPIRWVAANGIYCKGSLDHCAIYALPEPGYALHIVVLSEACLPELGKKTCPQPFLKVGVNSAGAAEPFFRKRLPLAARAQYVNNSFKNLS
jgi:hypothetical protein